jgi:hypothetical protein
MSSVTTPSTPLTGLGWPVSRETAEPDVSRETVAALGWPAKTPPLPDAGPGAAT